MFPDTSEENIYISESRQRSYLRKVNNRRILEFDRGTRDYRIAISVLESHDTAKDVTVSVPRNLPVKTFAKWETKSERGKKREKGGETILNTGVRGDRSDKTRRRIDRTGNTSHSSSVERTASNGGSYTITSLRKERDRAIDRFSLPCYACQITLALEKKKGKRNGKNSARAKNSLKRSREWIVFANENKITGGDRDRWGICRGFRAGKVETARNRFYTRLLLD